MRGNFEYYMTGYVKVRLLKKYEMLEEQKRGAFERFLNICTSKKIEIRKIAFSETYIEFYLLAKDYFLTRDICKKCGCKLKIVEKRGLPFRYKKLKYFKGFLAGVVIGFIILKIMTLYIWDISLAGGEKYQEETIIEYLNSIHVCHGMRRKEIDCEKIETMIRNKFYDIAWVCAEISGTRLIIHIKEGINLEQKKTNTNPCDLVATDSGIIDSIIVRAGTPIAKKGIKVKKGDLLVQSKIEVMNEQGEYAKDAFVHADADVNAIVKYRYESTTNRQYKRRVYTGTKRTDYFISFKNSSLLLKGIDKITEKEDEKKENRQLILLRNLATPIHFGKSTHQEYKEENAYYSEAEIKEEEKKKLLIFLQKLEKKGIQIIDKNVTINVDSKKGHSIGMIQGRKSIVKEHEISIPNETDTSENKEDKSE